MPKLRKNVTKDFTIICNTILRDKRVGSSARGVYCTMMSMADGWNFSIRGLAAIMGEGITKTSTALKKLEENKYLKRERVYEKGRIVDWEYFIYDEPYEAPEPVADAVEENTESPIFIPSQDTDLQNTEKLDTENLNQGHSYLEKPHDYKITKKEESKKEISSDQISIDLSSHENETFVENSDDRQMDGYVSKQQIYTEVVKSNIDFYDLVSWLENEKEAEEIVQMIVRQICSRKPMERICGQDFPREVVKAAMLKVDIYCLENAIEQMKQTDNIRNYEHYLISTLFNEANGRHFRENSESRWAEYAVKRDFGGQDATPQRGW